MTNPSRPFWAAGRPPQSRLVATETTPWLSVSLLAEHTFCHRAAAIQHESDAADTGEDPPLAKGRRRRLYFTLEQLRRELARRTTISLVLILATAACYVGYFATGIGWWLVAFIAGIGISLYYVLGLLGFWLSKYLPASFARANVPSPDHNEPVKVKWWNFIQAGYEPDRSEEGIRDTEWRLAGSPWRVLVHGDIHIPVFKARASKDKENRLYRKHWVRMMAYCQLIERNEGAKSPYGIVLFGDSLKGLTLPVSPGSRKTFHDALVATRQTVRELRPGGVVGVPGDYAKRCIRCPHSWRDRATGQSACGMRFSWNPPNFRDYPY